MSVMATPDRAIRSSSMVAGLGLMTRFFLRRNWARLLVWLAVIVGMTAVVVAYYKDQFDSPAALAERAFLSGSAGMKTVFGSVTSTGMGGAIWAEMWMFLACMLAIGLVFLVTRTNRADEEHGRSELLRSRPVSRTAALSSTTLILVILLILTAIGVACVFAVYDIGDGNTVWNSSLVMGASVSGVGLVGVGVALVANQVTTTSRQANALALIALGVFYAVRAVGDLKGNALVWASPIGWGQKMDPWGNNLWWPLALTVGLFLVCLIIAFVLQSRRDYGAGIIRSGNGPNRMPNWVTGEFALTVYLGCTGAVAWIVVLALWGMLLGATIDDMKGLADQLAPLSGSNSLDSIIALWVRVTALIAAAMVATQLLNLRSDEETGIMEARLATPVSRWRVFAARLAFTAISTTIALALSGAIMGLIYGVTVSDMDWVGKLAIASLAYLPSLAVIAGIALACYGWLPRLCTPITWAAIGLAWIIAIVGEMLKIPKTALDQLPFVAPDLPAANPDESTIIVTCAVALALILIGYLGYRRRGI